jgi:hypothetical protein
MVATMAAAPAPQAPQGKAKGAPAAVAARPFKYGVQHVDDVPYDVTVTTTSSTQQLNPVYEIPSTGFLEYVDILVESNATGNSSANSVTFAANGPFNAIDTVQFIDTNNQPIVGPFDGYQLMLVNKYGGYTTNDDPRNNAVYSATTGTGTTAGSFSFALRIPLELVERDGLGSLPNKSASTPFKVKITLAATATIYGTAPTNAPSVRVRMVPKSYWQPQGADMFGNPLSQNPPAVNTTQYWQQSTFTIAAGAFNQQLSSSTGFPIRNLVLMLTDSNSSRSQGESDWPDPLKLQLEANIIVDRIKKIWQTNIARDYGYSAAVGDAALGKDNGVYAEAFCKDFAHRPGWETRRSYLNTTDTMRLQARGTIGGSGSHTLSVLTNYVAPGQGTTLASIAA